MSTSQFKNLSVGDQFYLIVNGNTQHEYMYTKLHDNEESHDDNVVFTTYAGEATTYLYEDDQVELIPDSDQESDQEYL